LRKIKKTETKTSGVDSRFIFVILLHIAFYLTIFVCPNESESSKIWRIFSWS